MSLVSDGLYTYVGSDPADESDDWDGRPQENVFTNNIISDTQNGAKIIDADDNVFTCESKKIKLSQVRCRQQRYTRVL